MSLTEDTDELDFYSEEIVDMDNAVTFAVALQLIAAGMSIPNIAIIFGGLFPVFSYGLPPYPFFMILANYIYASILVILVLAFTYLAWALWNIRSRARFDAIIINTISIIVHLLSLSPVIVLNFILVYFLNSRRMKDIYIELTSEEVPSD
ncbi:MAG: hypothetical protein RTV41_05385 [Candidatus Thorarchaeota archaeon]